MSSKKRGLGRGVQDLGLGELLSDIHSAEQQSDQSSALKELGIEKVNPNPNQPRQTFDHQSLSELAESIKQQGILQPLVVRESGDQGYEIIAGERRWRAAQIAGLETVPAVLRNIDDEAAAAFMLIENLQREDLQPLEQAKALDRLKHEFNMQHQAIAEAIGKSRAAVTNYLRLLQLEKPVKELLEAGHLDIGHCKALLALEGQQQTRAAKHVVNKKLSVRQTERYVNEQQHADNSGNKQQAKQLDPNIEALQETLAQKLKATVKVQQSDKGQGKVVIHYNSLDELDGILSHIQ
jgi:ParB family chromosome partitioning protein